MCHHTQLLFFNKDLLFNYMEGVVMSTGVQMPTEVIKWCWESADMSWELDSGPGRTVLSAIEPSLQLPGVYSMAMISARHGAVTALA